MHQRLEIALLIGDTCPETADFLQELLDRKEYGVSEDSILEDIPDYDNSLDAANTIETWIQRVLGPDRWLAYVDILRRLSTHWGGAGAEICAPAEIRCKAFCELVSIEWRD